jgi:hypothetical protein
MNHHGWFLYLKASKARRLLAEKKGDTRGDAGVPVETTIPYRTVRFEGRQLVE